MLKRMPVSKSQHLQLGTHKINVEKKEINKQIAAKHSYMYLVCNTPMNAETGPNTAIQIP